MKPQFVNYISNAVTKNYIELNPNSKSIEEQVKISIINDLLNLNWHIEFDKNKIVIKPPEYYDKEIIRQSMGIKRAEIIKNNRAWINKHLNLARQNLADGASVLQSKIKPIFEVCERKNSIAYLEF